MQDGLRVAPMAPFITGDIAAPSMLTGQLISNVMYRWIRDLNDIVGATSQTYALTSANIGHLIRVRMSFTDADNNFITVRSKPDGPIQGPSAFVNANTFFMNDGSGSSLTVQMPANVVPDNLLFVWMQPSRVQSASAVAGWTLLSTATADDWIVANRR